MSRVIDLRSRVAAEALMAGIFAVGSVSSIARGILGKLHPDTSTAVNHSVVHR